MRRFLTRCAWALTALLCAGQAGAEVLTLKFANQNNKGHPIVLGMDKFAELVAAKSQGQIVVKVFPGGMLGSDQSNLPAAQYGALEMVAMNSGILASLVKEFAVFDFPFMFASGAEADAVVDGRFGQKMHAKLQAQGLVGLAYYELGFRNITNSLRPIKQLDDLRGLKLRVIPSPINIDWVQALGAQATPLPWPEVYGALASKAVDGQENPLATIFSARLFEVQSHLVLTRHQYNPQSVLISKKVWDKLTPAQQRLLQEAATESAAYQRQQARSQSSDLLAQLKAKGMQVTELPPPELARLRDKIQPVLAKYTAAVGPATVAELRAVLARLRQP